MNNVNKIEEFYISWKSGLEDYLKGYAYYENGKARKTRFAFLTLEKYLNKLLSNRLKEEEKIIIMPGIRGVGKTTLLSQLYFAEKFLSTKHYNVKEKLSKLDYKIYISADRLYAEGISLKDFFDFIEKKILGTFKDKKILFLIDEIQYDPNWSLFLKLLFDSTKGNTNILVVATGSSAIFLNQKNIDLARRAQVERILPAKFNEYLYLHKGIYPEANLSYLLKGVLFASQNAKEAFKFLSEKAESKIINKLSEIAQLEKMKEDYFLRGSFPFSAEMSTTQVALGRIKDMLFTNIVQKDLLLVGDFDAETLVKIPDLLFLLANSDEISTGKLADTLKISINTTNKILDALKNAEILFELKPYGKPYTQIRKPGKFLFTSPNIRAAILNGIFPVKLKGKMLEDYLALFFEKELNGEAKVLFDLSNKGADFILRFPEGREIVIEVGFGKSSAVQVLNTMKKSESKTKFGIVIGAEKLKEENNVLHIPLNYFLLF